MLDETYCATYTVTTVSVVMVVLIVVRTKKLHGCTLLKRYKKTAATYLLVNAALSISIIQECRIMGQPSALQRYNEWMTRISCRQVVPGSGCGGGARRKLAEPEAQSNRT